MARTQPSPPATLTGMTPYLLDQLGRAARRDLTARVRGDLGLSMRELWVIAVVDEGDTDLRAVADRLGLDRDAVADVAKGLEERKLLERVGKHGVTPTKAGPSGAGARGPGGPDGHHLGARGARSAGPLGPGTTCSRRPTPGLPHDDD